MIRWAIAVGALALLAAMPAAGKSGPLKVSLGSRPIGLTAGDVWTATVRVHRAGRPAAVRPTLLARAAGRTRTFSSRAVRRGVYRARVVLPEAGRWALSARAGGRSFALGRVAVRPVQLTGPTGIALDADGDVLFADRAAGRIMRMDLETRRLTVLARELQEPTGLDVDSAGNVWVAGDADQTVRRFTAAGRPAGVIAVPTDVIDVAVDRAGNAYVAGRDSCVHRIDGATGAVTVFAGTGVQGDPGDGGPATQATLLAPHGVAIDRNGDVLIADVFRVRRVDMETRVITTIGGTGVEGFSGDGGPATAGMLTALRVEPAPDGSVYIADNNNHRVRRISPTGVLTTVAGTGDQAFLHPFDIVIGREGSLLVVEQSPPRLLRIDPSTGTVTPIAGRR